jgi:hypothetical protein
MGLIMIWLWFWIFLFCVICAVIGVIVINKIGTYENIFGAMFFGGAFLAIVTLLIKIAVTIIFFLLSLL